MALDPQAVKHPVDDFADYRSPEAASFDKLVHAIDKAYHHPWRMAGRSFLHGFMSAVGASVGAALVIILSGYIFNHFGGVGFINSLAEQIGNGASRAIERQVQLLPENLQTTPSPTNQQAQ
jgi:hypothetical protein